MFFIMGITDGKKDFDFTQTLICDACGKYGRYQVFMTYMALSLFFIPCFKFNKNYYVRMSCCNTVYELDKEIGKCIAKGVEVEIRKEHLRQINNSGWNYSIKRCRNCGFQTAQDFEYCPKCGHRL